MPPVQERPEKLPISTLDKKKKSLRTLVEKLSSDKLLSNIDEDRHEQFIKLTAIIKKYNPDLLLQQKNIRDKERLALIGLMLSIAALFLMYTINKADPNNSVFIGMALLYASFPVFGFNYSKAADLKTKFDAQKKHYLYEVKWICDSLNIPAEFNFLTQIASVINQIEAEKERFARVRLEAKPQPQAAVNEEIESQVKPLRNRNK